MLEGNRKPETGETNPEAIARLLELELMQKRAAWQKAKGGRQNLRVLSFVFLFLVVMGALLASFFLMTSGELQELKSSRAAETATPTPAASPKR